MRIAVLSDIHGNLPALEAVLAELEADLVVVGGDVAAGPLPAETLDALEGLDARSATGWPPTSRRSASTASCSATAPRAATRRSSPR